MTEDRRDELRLSTHSENVLESASLFASAAPWIGGLVSTVLSGEASERRLERFRDFVTDLSKGVGRLEAASQEHVRSEEFQELFERTLRNVVDERSEAKQRLYGRLLGGSVRLAEPTFDEQFDLLRMLEELQPAHVMVLSAAAAEPAPGESEGLLGSVMQTLRRRLPSLSEAEIQTASEDLSDRRIVDLRGLRATMTPGGAADLRPRVGSRGQALVRFLRAGANEGEEG